MKLPKPDFEVTIKDVYFRKSGIRRAIIGYVHEVKREEFLTFRRNLRGDGNEYGPEFYEQDFDAFVETLDLDVGDVTRRIGIENDRYVVYVTYEIYERAKTK